MHWKIHKEIHIRSCGFFSPFAEAFLSLRCCRDFLRCRGLSGDTHSSCNEGTTDTLRSFLAVRGYPVCFLLALPKSVLNSPLGMVCKCSSSASPHSATSRQGREETWEEVVGYLVALQSGVALERHISQPAMRALPTAAQLSLQSPNYVSVHSLPRGGRASLQSCCPPDGRGQQRLPFTPRGLAAALVLACVTHLKRVWQIVQGFGTPPQTYSWDWVPTPSPNSW